MARPTSDDLAGLTEVEAAATADYARHAAEGTGYAVEQSTRPQTIGYGLTDSPAGQAAWIYEKLASWSDCGGDPTSILSMDEILDNIMLY